jgi:hypothetical protein
MEAIRFNTMAGLIILGLTAARHGTTAIVNWKEYLFSLISIRAAVFLSYLFGYRTEGGIRHMLPLTQII